MTQNSPIETPASTRRDFENLQIWQYRQQGLSYAKIAGLMDMTKSTIMRRLRVSYKYIAKTPTDSNAEEIDLTWRDFDRAVDTLARDLTTGVNHFKSRSIFGVPPNGWPLAVALSARTGLPLLLNSPRIATPGQALLSDGNIGTDAVIVVDANLHRGSPIFHMSEFLRLMGLWVEPLAWISQVDFTPESLRGVGIAARCRYVLRFDERQTVKLPWGEAPFKIRV